MSAAALNPVDDGIDRGALADLMRAHGLATAAMPSIERLTGGQSNPTFRVSAGSHRYVLRKKPAGQLLASAHAIDREYRVMGALRQSAVPVPKVYLYCDDARIADTPFYLMEFLDGRVLTDQSLPGMTRDDRLAIYSEMNRVIAALHAVDPANVGLTDFGKAGNYFGRQINRWTRQYRDSRTEDISAMEYLMEWLPAHVPSSERTAIVHGDYRLDNLVFHPTEHRAIGVLDWELATLGDPLADISYNCMSWHIPADLWRGIGGLDLRELGIPEESEYLKRYCDATGSSDAIEHWDFYLAYNLFRMAAILQGITKRAQDGNAAAADAFEMGSKAGPLADIGWHYARRYGASHERV
jgi:aminoglycoside phosphotransferase (APT) family kinase protein